MSELYFRKCFATDGSERDPVAVFNLFARNRPEKMKAGIKTTGFKITAAERHLSRR